MINTNAADVIIKDFPIVVNLQNCPNVLSKLEIFLFDFGDIFVSACLYEGANVPFLTHDKHHYVFFFDNAEIAMRFKLRFV